MPLAASSKAVIDSVAQAGAIPALDRLFWEHGLPGADARTRAGTCHAQKRRRQPGPTASLPAGAEAIGRHPGLVTRSPRRSRKRNASLRWDLPSPIYPRPRIQL